MKVLQHLGNVLSTIHPQSMVGLSYITSFFSLSPPPLLAPFQLCIKINQYLVLHEISQNANKMQQKLLGKRIKISS